MAKTISKRISQGLIIAIVLFVAWLGVIRPAVLALQLTLAGTIDQNNGPLIVWGQIVLLFAGVALTVLLLTLFVCWAVWAFDSNEIQENSNSPEIEAK